MTLLARGRCLLAPLLAAGALAGCGGLSGRPATRGPATTERAATAGQLDERALLLLLVDRQEVEPLLVDRALHGGPALREALAEALGRVGEAGGRSYLSELLGAAEPAVRRAAAFALGELDLPATPAVQEGDAAGGGVAATGAAAVSADRRAAARALLVAAVDPDRETGRLAVEALGKLGVSVVEVLGALTAADLPEGERWARLLPGLFRFDEEATAAAAAGGLAAVSDPELHRWAVYALARNPRPVALPALRELTADPDPRVRAWAARALGIVGEPAADLPRLAALLADTDPGPRIEALRAAGVLRLAEPEAAPPAGWSDGFLRAVADPLPHVRLAALDAAAPWLPDPRLVSALAAVAAPTAEDGAAAAAGDPAIAVAERAAALEALAEGGGAAIEPRLAGWIGAAAGDSSSPRLRSAATTAAAALGEPGSAILRRLLADPDPTVRTAALSAALGDEAQTAGPAGVPAEIAARALAEDRDPGVRAVVFGWLAEHPVVGYVAMTRATQDTLEQGNPEAALSAVEALAARALAEPRERGGVVAVLEKLAATADWLVRRAAAGALARLDRPVPPVAGPRGRPPGVYSAILERAREPVEVEMVTAVGTLRLRLDCPRAPLTCLSFLNLAGQGFYDGLTFHRVVPDFVVQGGDPRGDGFGGPGYALRDEIGRLRYERGTLGMALAGPDTGGSQFFITLAPQPHLDGGYTAFGRVVAGDEVLDRITRGTVIERVREVGGSLPQSR